MKYLLSKSRALFSSLIGLLLLFGAVMGLAGQVTESADVTLIETDDADCLLHGGKRISLKLVDSSKTVTVWVDRWFMQIQTPDHTKHVLSQSKPESALGCSATRAGAQHWTIYSMESQ